MTDYSWVTHQGKFWQFLDLAGSHSVAKRHLIWNLRTGEEVASWSPPHSLLGSFYQTELMGRDKDHVTKAGIPFVLSLSATGKYLAEGGSGLVTLYSVRP